mmetsp:Transcript_18834/g.52624  ORF Transcript_18834/g.52624 Transcript_18834/m.52624 type:complete len:235 (-) Transcript_18834:982-1686(-)
MESIDRCTLCGWDTFPETLVSRATSARDLSFTIHHGNNPQQTSNDIPYNGRRCRRRHRRSQRGPLRDHGRRIVCFFDLHRTSRGHWKRGTGRTHWCDLRQQQPSGQGRATSPQVNGRKPQIHPTDPDPDSGCGDERNHHETIRVQEKACHCVEETGKDRTKAFDGARSQLQGLATPTFTPATTNRGCPRHSRKNHGGNQGRLRTSRGRIPDSEKSSRGDHGVRRRTRTQCRRAG